MKRYKVLGILLIVAGALMIVFSDYIATQVQEGKMQIRSAQSQVDTAESVFSMSKYTKPIGKTFTQSAQKKIDAGQREVDKYETVSSSLKIGGIILIVIGAVVLLMGSRRKS